jgi:hypothetical protein
MHSVGLAKVRSGTTMLPNGRAAPGWENAINQPLVVGFCALPLCSNIAWTGAHGDGIHHALITTHGVGTVVP